ncbi:MAG: 16S rRNA (uracil(1498)-N(3))-methyltransferase [Bacteroidales bacterium]|nr:MAG: 16S rRNA (uracil(1498)-N(3))-methyltransferase [Bacteroidales bacterium]
MHVFYSPEISSGNLFLNKTESKHCIRVLRLRENDIINLIDGKGGLYEARIVSENPDKCELQVIKQIENYNKRNFYLHIAIALTKSTDRYEWFIEKATEIGIDEITPLICSRSERRKIKIERLQKIIISSMKQALVTTTPGLNKVRTFSEFISDPAINEFSKYICYCSEGNRQKLNEIYHPGTNAVAVIGPEGDFTPEEIKLAKKYNFQSVTLGKNRLRTETAGVSVCQILNFLND